MDLKIAQVALSYAEKKQSWESQNHESKSKVNLYEDRIVTVSLISKRRNTSIWVFWQHDPIPFRFSWNCAYRCLLEGNLFDRRKSSPFFTVFEEGSNFRKLGQLQKLLKSHFWLFFDTLKFEFLVCSSKQAYGSNLVGRCEESVQVRVSCSVACRTARMTFRLN